MTVAWFFETFPFGGAEKVALDLARGFRAAAPGVRPVIIVRRFASRPDDVECVELGSDAPLRKPAGLQALADALRRIGADVYIQAMDAPQGMLASLRELMPELKIIYHLHNTPYWQVRRKTAGRPMAALREALFGTYSRRYRRRYASDYAAAHCWVALCPGYTRNLRLSLGPNVKTIYNPVDLSLFFPLQNVEKQREVLYVGRLSRADKRVDRLLRVWARVWPVHRSWKLKIVGDGPDEASLRRLAARLKLQNVEFCGATSTPEQHYATASILCQTSDYEGWPLVLTEALASGVRVVAMECTDGVAEIVARGKAEGVKAGDEREFARRLSAMMARPGGNGGEARQFLTSLGLEATALQWQRLLAEL